MFGPENLDPGHGDIDRRVRESLTTVNLDGWGDERVDSLSGGEVERLVIVSVLAIHPDHLVLDEPFIGLDEPVRHSVLARLHGLRAEGMSLVVVTHDLYNMAELADRMVVPADSDVVPDAAPDEAAGRLPDLDTHPPC